MFAQRTNFTRWLVAGLALLLIGCGPTRTAGTQWLAGRELAVLSVPQLPKAAHVRIETIRFDGDDAEYKIGSGRDFYLLPRDRTASFKLRAVLPAEAGFAGKFIPKDALSFSGPQLPLGPVSAGKSYELTAPTSGIEAFLQTGRLSFVREKNAAK